MRRFVFILVILIGSLNTVYASEGSNVSYTGTIHDGSISASARLVWEIKNSSIVSVYFSNSNNGNSETEFNLSDGETDFYLIYSVRGNANAKLSIKANGAMTTGGSGRIDWGIYRDNSVVSGWSSTGSYEYAELGTYSNQGNIPLQLRVENIDNADIVVGDNVEYASSMGVKVEII